MTPECICAFFDFRAQRVFGDAISFGGAESSGGDPSLLRVCRRNNPSAVVEGECPPRFTPGISLDNPYVPCSANRAVNTWFRPARAVHLVVKKPPRYTVNDSQSADASIRRHSECYAQHCDLSANFVRCSST